MTDTKKEFEKSFEKDWEFKIVHTGKDAALWGAQYAFEKAAKKAECQQFLKVFDVTQELHNILCAEIVAELRQMAKELE